MDHTTFVQKYNEGEIAVDVDRNKAGFMYEQQGLMPQDLRARQTLFRTAAFGGFILGIALFFFAEWWIALGVLMLALYMFPKSQSNAAEGVLQASLRSSAVYDIAVQNEVLLIRDATSPA